MENKYINDDVLRISFKDLFMRLCLKWKQGIVWALILAVVLNGVAIVQDYKTGKAIEERMNMTEKEIAESNRLEMERRADEIREKLSDREIEEVERSVASYEELLVKYNNALAYNEKSIKMKLDPNEVPTILLQYNVDSNYEVVYPMIATDDNAEDIIGALCATLTDTDIYDQMAENMEEECDAKYLSEIISTTASADNFIIEIMCLSKNDCYIVSDIIKNKLEEEATRITQTFGTFELTLLSEQYTEGPQPDILTNQAEQASVINTIKNTLNNLYYGLTEDQKEYYYAVLDSNKLERMKTEMTDGQEAETVVTDGVSAEMSNSLKLFHVKYMLLGAFLGLLLVCAWEIIKYIMSYNLRTKEDMEEIYEIVVFGEIRSKKCKGSDKKIIDWFKGRETLSLEKQQELISANIKMTSDKLGMGNIVLTSTSECEEVVDAQSDIFKVVSKHMDNITDIKSVLYNPDSLESLAQADGVVLVEKIDVTRYADIKKIANQCRNNNIPIIGSIILE